VILEFTSNAPPGERRPGVDRGFPRIEYVQAKGQVVTVVQFVGNPRSDSPLSSMEIPKVRTSLFMGASTHSKPTAPRIFALIGQLAPMEVAKKSL